MWVLLSLWFLCLTIMVLDHVYIAAATYNCYLSAFSMHEKKEVALHENLFWLCLVHCLCFKVMVSLICCHCWIRKFKTFMYMFFPVEPTWTYLFWFRSLYTVCAIMSHVCCLTYLECPHMAYLWPWFLSILLRWPCACFQWSPNHKPVCYQSVCGSIVLIMFL